MLRSIVAFGLATLIASVASADAIMSFDGVCPPGLESAIRNHSEVCAPRACLGASDCPEGSACSTLFECWARRPYSGGRLPSEDAPLVDTVIGLCDAERHCEEGLCRERRQCEPTAPTAAWDPAERRWTGTSYVPSSSCAAGRAGSSAIAITTLALLMIGLARRRA